jgi:hypothetical protein
MESPTGHMGKYIPREIRVEKHWQNYEHFCQHLQRENTYICCAAGKMLSRHYYQSLENRSDSPRPIMLNGKTTLMTIERVATKLNNVSL